MIIQLKAEPPFKLARLDERAVRGVSFSDQSPRRGILHLVSGEDLEIYNINEVAPGILGQWLEDLKHDA